MATVRLYSQCHCRRQTYQVDIPRSSLPLPNEMCHCYDCRHITGMLAGDYAELDGLEKDIFDVNAVPSGLNSYRKKGGRVTWYFCDNCSAHIVSNAIQADGSFEWLFSIGTIYPLALEDGTRTTKLRKHMFVNYTQDEGGLTKFLPDGVQRYIDDSLDDDKVASPDHTRQSAEDKEAIQKATDSSTLPLSCHCGHVKLNVHRPSSKPIPKGPPNYEACAVDDGWLWTFCLCSSCRTTTGFDLSSFFFMPYSHITGPPGSKHPTDGLKVYSSYPGRRRHSCPKCGCSIFFDRDDRGELCDVFLGAVDIPLSVLFSSWIRPAKNISFGGYAKNKDLAQTLVNGFCPGKDLSLDENSIKQSADYGGTLQL